MPGLKKKYLYAEDFAKAGLHDMFSSEKLNGADVMTAEYFANSILINQGNLNFTIRALPWEAQLSSIRDAVVVDANGDDLPDILMVGNYYENNIQMGRYDADFGTLLINRGQGNFTAEPIPGVQIKGQSRHIRPIRIFNKQAYIIARNNDSAKVISFLSNNNP